MTTQEFVASILFAIFCLWFGYQLGFIAGGTEQIRRQTEARRRQAEIRRAVAEGRR